MTWFNAADIEPSGALQQFPVGRHPVVIRSSAKQAVKDKPQEGMLVLTLEVIDGPAKGVSGPYRLNLWNSSAQACEIAQKQLSALCHVIGIHQLADQMTMCSELFGKPFIIAVSPQNDPKYTQIDGVLDMAGNPAKRGQVPSAPPAQAQAPQQPAQPPQQGAPSWGQQPQQPPAQQPPAQSAPSWGAPPAQPATAAPATPSWGAPPLAAPAQPANPGQPSWSAPPTGGAPAWGR